MSRFALAIDIGGTFTDLVLRDAQAGVLSTEKVLTTPEQPEEAILDGIDSLAERADFDLRDTDLFLHATTIITNAVIERAGYDFALLHTKGFRDVPEIGREHRYNLTNLRLRFPRPLSPRTLRIGVDERVSAFGSVTRAPERDRVLRAVDELLERHDLRSFAVCFLHSYRNPANEVMVGEWLATAYPDAYISLSSTVAPAQREYERWTTCHINAYTLPLLADYLDRLTAGLRARGFAGSALMMTSAGSPMAFHACSRFPVRLIESGPAAGVLAAREIGARNEGSSEHPNLLAFDMGGTTAKGAFLTDGVVRTERALEVARVGAFEAGSGFPLLTPSLDLIEIGAGGGSIAEVDSRGAIMVGPKSAGAVPGPACYARGGEQATLTDANIVLGLLDEESFRSSGITVRAELAHQAVGEHIAHPLGLSIERAAQGVHDTANEDVARAFRVHAAELGLDYRRYTLVCTGGSAGLHAAEIARILNIGSLLFPFAAGVSSAFGLFAAPEGTVLQETYITPLAALDRDAISARIARRVKGDPYATEMVSQGAVVNLTLDLRYAGQGYEISIPLGRHAKRYEPHDIQEAFEREYTRVFGMTFPGYEVEVFNWTVKVSYPDPVGGVGEWKYAAQGGGGARDRGKRCARIGSRGEAISLAVVNRYALTPGEQISGNTLLEETDSTIYLPAFAHARVLPSLDILAEIETKEGA